MSEVFHSHVGVVHLKVLNLSDSEQFYDYFYQVLTLNKKDKTGDYVGYWGNFGILLTEQKNHLINVQNDFKTGIAKLSIFVSDKNKVDEVYHELSQYGYHFEWKPQDFDYSKGYYSTCIADPDDNQIEIYYAEPSED